MKNFRRLQRQEEPDGGDAAAQKYQSQEHSHHGDDQKIDRNPRTEHRLADELGESQPGKVTRDTAHKTRREKLRQD